MIKGLGAVIVGFASLLSAAAATASTPGLTTAVYLNGEPDTSLALDRVAAAGATAVRVNMWWSLVAGSTPPADPTVMTGLGATMIDWTTNYDFDKAEALINATTPVFTESSMSFMTLSMLRGAAMFADKIFLTFSTPAYTRWRALGLLLTSILYFSLKTWVK